MSGAPDPRAHKWAILRLLVEHPEGVTSRDLAHVWGWNEPIPGRRGINGSRWQQTLAHVGQDLRLLRRRGLAERSGRVREGWGKGNPFLWHATPAAVGFLDEITVNAARITARKEHKATDPARREQAATAAEAAADVVARLYPAGIPAGKRRVLERELRARGCSLRTIAAVCGVSAEMVRKDLLAG